MAIFSSEKEFLSILDSYDKLVRDCATGKLLFDQFVEKYGDFPRYYALDGHESDDEEKQLFKKYAKRIQAHLKLSEKVLSSLCSDEDSVNEQYIKAGRIGSKDALVRLQEIVRNYF